MQLKKKPLPRKRGRDPNQSKLQSFLKFFIRLHHLEGGSRSSAQLQLWTATSAAKIFLFPTAQKIFLYPHCLLTTVGAALQEHKLLKRFSWLCASCCGVAQRQGAVCHSRVKYFQSHNPDPVNSSLPSLASGSSFDPLLLWSTCTQ